MRNWERRERMRTGQLGDNGERSPTITKRTKRMEIDSSAFVDTQDMPLMFQ